MVITAAVVTVAVVTVKVVIVEVKETVSVVKNLAFVLRRRCSRYLSECPQPYAANSKRAQPVTVDF